ncbi:MAG: transposase family protein [Bifidobacteriaceae bacterium]|jgi:transposase InsO family protein|nr:transposase family protein [Bifidobacteriaceae bacterium]
MGFSCGKYLVAMLELWLPLLAEAGDLDQPFATVDARRELGAMSAATIDRYLAADRRAMALKGAAATKPSPLLRNSIKVRKAGDEHDGRPGLVEADTVAHCGPTLAGEFARTLTMTDVATGWTQCASNRNNASRWIVQAVAALRDVLPFPIRQFASDNGSEFINHQVADGLQGCDIAQSRSRPYKKNDQATVESKNNHVVRKHAFHWRYDTPAELDLLNRLWRLVSLRLNFFTPTRKPLSYQTTASGRRKRVYDQRGASNLRSDGGHRRPGQLPSHHVQRG